MSRKRRGVLRASEVADAAITATHLGEQGVEKVFGVIYPPRVGLVGFGRILERPWAEHGMVGVRPVLAARLSAYFSTITVVRSRPVLPLAGS